MTKSLVGKKFGRLSVEDFNHRTPSNKMAHYKCRCECGKETVVSHGNLQSLHTLSCGCLRLEKLSEPKSHRMSKNNKTYKSWLKMKERCLNPNSPDYYNYGAKGVKVHQSFLDDFMNFYKEVGTAPVDGHNWSIDRIDHTKNYEPGNLRWATDAQQARNKGKMKNNTSGVNGVSWDNKKHPTTDKYSLYACVQIHEYDLLGNKKIKKKAFSVNKLGLLPAFALAVQYRKDQIARLNALGYGYAENHGQ